MKDVECPECYETDVVLWKELPMNETIREYAQSYISPVKMFHLTFEDAEWSFEKEESISHVAYEHQ